MVAMMSGENRQYLASKRFLIMYLEDAVSVAEEAGVNSVVGAA